MMSITLAGIVLVITSLWLTLYLFQLLRQDLEGGSIARIQVPAPPHDVIDGKRAELGLGQTVAGQQVKLQMVEVIARLDV